MAYSSLKRKIRYFLPDLASVDKVQFSSLAMPQVVLLKLEVA
jgi:hypothetical protein